MKSENDPLQIFLYVLMRDYLTSGKIEKILSEHVYVCKDKTVVFTNTYLAQYAAELSKELRS